jgi:hypothetical protein
MREWIVERLEENTKEEVMHKCHIHRFEDFYEYFKSFIVELKEGPAANRMTKTLKTKIMKEIHLTSTP